LNDLKITCEEMLLRGLWRPLADWLNHGGIEHQEKQAFLTLRIELQTKGMSPDLYHFEQVCKMPITYIFLKEKGISLLELEWFSQGLVNSLSKLRLVRNQAEHTSVTGWTRQGVKQYFDEFLGIGRPGVLLRLAKILFAYGKTAK